MSTLAVVHLVRHANGLGPFTTFVTLRTTARFSDIV